MSSTTSIASVCNEDNKCANCCTQLLGPHCYACGQPVKGMVRHFSSVIGDFLDTLLAFDSRTWKTIPALFFRPGFLTTEYFSGRRVRYVSPVRLFIFLCITSLFVTRLSGDWDITLAGVDIPHESSRSEILGIAPSSHETELVRAEEIQRKGLLAELNDIDASLIKAKEETEKGLKEAIENEVERGYRDAQIASREGLAPEIQPEGNAIADDKKSRFIRVDIEGLPKPFQDWIDGKVQSANQNIKQVTEDPNRLKKAFLKVLPYALIVMLPIFALMLWVLYIFKRRLYMEHFIVALHSHAFIFLSILIANILYMISSKLISHSIMSSLYENALVSLSIWVLIYLFWMQKRIYQQGWFMTLCKYSFVGMAYLCLLSVSVALTIVWSLAEL
ncbi:DUF3667 domain-containing protein [Microbulbifer sp. TRSA001]|uniref:DUF3667 domain-containing protein n=1 Tax=Microbulbifer sp. TRSA001 TaxID=3243381 RepID=UPI00403A71B2